MRDVEAHADGHDFLLNRLMRESSPTRRLALGDVLHETLCVSETIMYISKPEFSVIYSLCADKLTALSVDLDLRDDDLASVRLVCAGDQVFRKADGSNDFAFLNTRTLLPSPP